MCEEHVLTKHNGECDNDSVNTNPREEYSNEMEEETCELQSITQLLTLLSTVNSSNNNVNINCIHKSVLNVCTFI